MKEVVLVAMENFLILMQEKNINRKLLTNELKNAKNVQNLALRADHEAIMNV